MPTLTRPDGVILHYSVAYADEPKASVLLTHGYGEYAERYRETIDAWTQRGLTVASYDVRGHGESGGKRGHVGAFRDYIEDALALLAELAKDERWTRPGPPLLFGHSVGGLISLHLLLEPGSEFRGAVLSSPYLKLALEVPAIKKGIGRALSKRWATFSQPATIRGSDVTHDAELARFYDESPRFVRRVTARWFTEVEAAQRDILQRGRQIKAPIRCLAAGDDRVARVETTREFFASLDNPEQTMEVVPGAYHELLNEVERAEYRARFTDLLLELAERKA